MDFLFVIGTRAELIKMAPVMWEFQNRNVPFFFLHTGQHDISDLVKLFKVKAPDLSLSKPKAKRGQFGTSILKAIYWNLKQLLALRAAIIEQKPKFVLCHGDTMTTTIAALATKSIFFPPKLVHVEAGLRSGNILEPWPEELSRIVTDFLSDICFAPTEKAAKNLGALGFTGKKIFVTGNTNIDVLKLGLKLASTSKFKLPAKPYIFAQMHRQENISNKKRLEEFLKFITGLNKPVVFVYLENTRRQVEKFNLSHYIKAKNLVVSDNLSYNDFMKVFSNASMVVTDSGGETEEATFLGIPTIVFRRFSEREEAEEVGVAVKYGSYGLRKIFAKPSTIFGNGAAANKIVNLLVSK